MDDKISFLVPGWKRILLLVCAVLLGFAIGNIIIALLIHLKGSTPAIMRISAVLQDVFMFILPAIVTAVFVTRLPAQFLCIDKKPRWGAALAACVILLLSVPAMNALVAWNEGLKLPESMAAWEESMRQAEEAAQAAVSVLIGGKSIGSLVVSILIVGVFAGFSEEIFFRGAFQRLLSTSGVNAQAAVWIVAFVFSATHLQFYGFFGRLLLGAYFGYLLIWTRNLWIPIIVHIFNNTVYIVGEYITMNSDNAVEINSFGSDKIALIIASVVWTALGIYYFRKRFR